MWGNWSVCWENLRKGCGSLVKPSDCKRKPYGQRRAAEALSVSGQEEGCSDTQREAGWFPGVYLWTLKVPKLLVRASHCGNFSLEALFEDVSEDLPLVNTMKTLLSRGTWEIRVEPRVPTSRKRSFSWTRRSDKISGLISQMHNFPNSLVTVLLKRTYQNVTLVT